MTYQHALRYLTQSSENATMSILHLFPSTYKTDVAPLFICLGSDKQSKITGEMLRAILSQANIDHLSYLHDETIEPKQRFLHNGKPLPPPVLCHHATDIRAAELRQAKEWDSSSSLPAHERAIELLARCAAEAQSRVILLEYDGEIPLVRLLRARLPRAGAITVLSDGQRNLHGAICEGIREVISPAGGQALFRRISDACARTGSRLTLVAAASCQRTAITPASQLLTYRTLHNCRILSAGEQSARAGFLTLQTVLSLSRYGLSVSEEEVRTGIGRADLTRHCTLLSIDPMILADTVCNEQELSISLKDILALAPLLPAPHHLWLDPVLPSPAPLPAWVDVLHQASDPDVSPETGSAIWLGSPSFIQNLLWKSKKRQF